LYNQTRSPANARNTITDCIYVLTRQSTFLKRNIEMRSYYHCCSGKQWV